MNSKLTTEERKELLDAYVRGDRVRDIADRFGIVTSQVTHIVRKMGTETRRHPKPRGGKKTCPKCHRKIEVKEAKFCYFCGSDIRDARDILIERVLKATELISLLPDSARDEMQMVLKDVVEELKKK